MTQLWAKDNGLIDVSSAFQGVTNSLAELVDDLHRRGWTLSKLDIHENQYRATGKNPHGEKLEAYGRTDATAVANLLVRVMRREFGRGASLRARLGSWDHRPIESQWAQIAQAYAQANVYDPKAAPSFMSLAQDFARRAQMVRMQIAIEVVDNPTPYESADKLREDVTKKRHLSVSRAYPHHPVWSEQQMIDYRTVVDVLGHAATVGDWGWHGTVLAFCSLAPLLDDECQKALYTELLGQSAFGSYFQSWGPQKVCHLQELIEKEQEKENKPGHHPVHPSQSIVPTSIPSIFTKVAAAIDPNTDWQSGVSPLQDNAYLWQRQNGVDPLDAQGVSDSLHPLESGIANMHPELMKQSVINALRGSLLGTRNNSKGHAVHYQDLMHLPASVDDPIAFWDALEQRREQHNQAQGYAPGSHKQYWPEEQQFKQWVKAANPHLDDADVQREAKRELLHMLTEEEEKILASDEAEQLPAEVIEHEAYEALRRRLKALTKPTVDQKVDFGDEHLYHEASDHLQWTPGQPGKGSINRKLEVKTWPVDERGQPSHANGTWPYNSPEEFGSMRHFEITPEGEVLPVHYQRPGYQANPYAEDSLDIPLDIARNAINPKTSTHHADMYPPYLTSRMRPLAQLGRHADDLSEAARQDLLLHGGKGHHFRAQALNLGINGLGPRQVSQAWLHLAPQTSQLGIVNPEIAEVLSQSYPDLSNRDFFKAERMLAAGRDAAGYGHVPLGAFSTGLWDLYAHGPGAHPDRTPLKAYAPTPHHTVDWDAQSPPMTGWDSPYWWESTQEAREGAAQDFDRSVATQFPKDEVPFQKTAMAERSGFPDLDQAIEEFMQANPEIAELRDPQNAWGRCQEIAEQCAAFLKERGFQAYAPSDDLHAFEGYHDAQDSAAIGAGDFSYPEHAVVEVYGMYGPNNVNNVFIDFTASQYGFTEFPKVHGGPSDQATPRTAGADDYIEGFDGPSNWGGAGENYNPEVQPPGEPPIYVEANFRNVYTGQNDVYRGPVMKILPRTKRGQELHTLVINPTTTLDVRPGDYTVIPTGDLQSAPEVPPSQPEHFSAVEGRSPWVTNPTTGERLTGPPGTSLMSHVKATFGHPSVHDVWNAEYEVGKDAGAGSTIARVTASPEPSLTPDQDRFIDDLRRSDYRILSITSVGQGAVEVVTDSVTFLVTPSGFAERRPGTIAKVANPQIMYHVAPQRHRESIAQHGLDWRKGNMPAPVSGEYEVLPQANYLYHPSSNWREIVRPDTDVYEVNVSGLPLEVDPYEDTEAMMTHEPIPPERLRRLT